MRVFLGGTCNGSQWRTEAIEMLTENGIDYFNPVVDDWNKEAQEKERWEKQECDICMYVITPKMTGVYAIAEVVEDSYKRPEKTVFVLLQHDDDKLFTEEQWRSLKAVVGMVAENAAVCFSSIENAISYLSKK